MNRISPPDRATGVASVGNKAPDREARGRREGLEKEDSFIERWRKAGALTSAKTGKRILLVAKEKVTVF